MKTSLNFRLKSTLGHQHRQGSIIAEIKYILEKQNINSSIMKLFEFLREYGNEDIIVEKLQGERLLKSNSICDACGEIMIYRKTDKKDGIMFMCKSRSCRKTKSIRSGTFFENVRLNLCDSMLLLHLWSKGYSEKLILDDFSFAKQTVVDWFRFCRELCVDHFDENQVMIGGPGCVIEIDETHVVRRKYNRGRILQAGWLFGGIMRRSDGQFHAFFRLIYNRCGDHLKYLIRQHVIPGTHIITDGWQGYNGLSDLGYIHTVIIHQENFVYPSDRETNTQQIEATWGSLKRFIRSHGTNKGEFLVEYICEYIFRRKFENVFRALIDVIRVKYPIN